MDDMRIKYEHCPLCGHPVSGEIDVTAASGHHPLWVPGLDEMRWVHCVCCGHVHVQSYLSLEARQLVFERATNRHVAGVEQLEGERYFLGAIIEWMIERARTPGLRWLDIGSGNGAFLLTLAEYGFEPEGVEVRAGEDRWNGIRIHRGEFPPGSASLKQTPGYDVVSMLDVVEHMVWPKEALTCVRDLLVSRGFLLIATPNLDCPLWNLLGKNNPYWSEVEHAHCFGYRRLERLLSELGFDVLAFTISQRYRLGMQLLARKR